MRIAAGIEYRGTGYAGWQRQDHAESIQGHVERALSNVADHPIQVQCAGRTDAGVHALQQVVHFDSDAPRDERAWVLGTKTWLPDAISLLWTRAVPGDFHARFSALGRGYHYVILNRDSRPGLWQGLISWECRALDAGRMMAAAPALLGRHDFTSYRGQGCQAKTAWRELRRLDVHRHGDLIVLHVEANAFLHHMVRNIAGVLIAIGLGTRPVSWAAEVLAARDRTAGGITAAADGLYLTAVNYGAGFGIPPREFAASSLFPFVAEPRAPAVATETAGEDNEDCEN
jgi:tRNA pseudouridine38-40 synthase